MLLYNYFFLFLRLIIEESNFVVCIIIIGDLNSSNNLFIVHTTNHYELINAHHAIILQMMVRTMLINFLSISLYTDKVAVIYALLDVK